MKNQVNFGALNVFVLCLCLGWSSTFLFSGCRLQQRGSSHHVSNSPSGEASLDHAVLRKNLEGILGAESNCNGNEAHTNPMQLRLLSNSEYSNSIRDVFRIPLDVKSMLPNDQITLGFKNLAPYSLISSDHASAYQKVSSTIADEVVDNNWNRLIQCQVNAGRSCAELFIKTYASSIWRKRLTAQELNSLLKLYDAGGSADPALGLKLMIRGLLNSGNFLYRSEIGVDGKLTPFELASSIAYFIWGSSPDLNLLQAADRGTLQDKQAIAEQVRRMLKDERAKRGTRALADAWLQFTDVLSVTKDNTTFPRFDSVRLALAQETAEFFDYMVRKNKAKFSDLFLADFSLGDSSLAAFYGAQASPFGNLSILKFQSQPRLGILGHGSILSSLAYAQETSPVKRGKFVREHLLCDILMPPPGNLMIKVPDRKEGMTTRERFTAHSSQELCKSCHIKIDGVGFAMEDFDAIGSYRTIDSGKPVDFSGKVVGLDGKDVQTNGLKELSIAISGSVRAKKCFTIHAWRLAHGRLETEKDVCHLRRLTTDIAERNLSIDEVFVEVISDPDFIARGLVSE